MPNNLIVNQKSVRDLFQNNKTDFLIPDYQRPYAWGKEECGTLWEDIFEFAIPGADATKFNSDKDEYFLGPIVTYQNGERQLEIIDGQQRLTTLMLLLRAFYDYFTNMQDQNSIQTREAIGKCIWKTDEFGNPDKQTLKINSEVATDNDKDEFLSILRTGITGEKQKSRYAENFRFFMQKIQEFLIKYPTYFSYLPIRILNNCILLPIEAESQDTALRIFSTLNDRGLPLSDSDIFKAQFYKYYSDKEQKDAFIDQWKKLEELCGQIFQPKKGTPLDELFTRYMYFIRAKRGNKNTTTEALRKFYEQNGYSLLKEEQTFGDLKDLADFWNDVANQDRERFSERVLHRLFVLHFAPNGMWTYFVSVYYMQHKDEDFQNRDESFYLFLDRMIAFIWAYSIFRPGVNSLRTPLYQEMINIVNGSLVEFKEFKFNGNELRNLMYAYDFYNQRPITKSMLAWWAFNDNNQELLDIDTTFDIEHIFAKNRAAHEPMNNQRALELLGNKSLLEKRINIRASDYKYIDKKKYYQGFNTAQGITKKGTMIAELREMASERLDFCEQDIHNRHEAIIDGFIDFLRRNDLLQ
jgi:hypothetical protein